MRQPFLRVPLANWTVCKRSLDKGSRHTSVL